MLNKTKDFHLVADFLGQQDIRTTQGYISSRPQRKQVITDGLIKCVGAYKLKSFYVFY